MNNQRVGLFSVRKSCLSTSVGVVRSVHMNTICSGASFGYRRWRKPLQYDSLLHHAECVLSHPVYYPQSSTFNLFFSDCSSELTLVKTTNSSEHVKEVFTLKTYVHFPTWSKWKSVHIQHSMMYVFFCPFRSKTVLKTRINMLPSKCVENERFEKLTFFLRNE